jgi:16S rRNA (uracil1498-N3)-methyltransferase
VRVPRVYVEAELLPGTDATLGEDAAAHLARVLRLRTGDPVTLFNGDGRDYAGRLSTLAKREARVTVEAAGDAEPEPPLAIALAIGVSRGERMDFVIQKAVELGVTGILPLLTERSVVRLDDERADRRLSHWRGVLVAACEQSGRRRLPALRPAVAWRSWTLPAEGVRLLLDPGADATLPTLAPPRTAVTLLVGPEGGLTDAERARAIGAGYTPIRLGPRILRAETAPLAALAAMQVLWGDMR